MKQKHAGGRPSKLTDALQTQIVADVKAGNYAEIAAKRAGIGEKTFYRWMAWGEQSRPRYAEFRQAIRDAEGHAEARAVTVIAAEMAKDWKAAAWYLERKFHDRWGRRDRQEVTGKDGAPVPVQFIYELMPPRKTRETDDGIPLAKEWPGEPGEVPNVQERIARLRWPED